PVACTIDWDIEGEQAELVNTSAEGDNSYTCTSSRTIYEAGVYTIEARIEDNHGGTCRAKVLIVVYDPSAGFVTGGGWIDSPERAYVTNPSLTGKATFGFVSKYKKGANVPTGETEFQFKVANLNFNSESYEWLVVAGARAQFKGTGTINGSGSFGFMLTAIDGEIKGDGIDKFRIKIWDSVTELIVYDNQLGAEDDGEAATALGGGSILIHTKK
ncbi:MAG: hypothetical protein P8Z37_17740, partial [Acidobacteriota bacterium]